MERVKYSLVYHRAVKKDVSCIPKRDREEIQKLIEEKLRYTPLLVGEALRGNLSHYRKLRIASYRVVYHVNEGEVFIIAILHRREVYQRMRKRIK